MIEYKNYEKKVKVYMLYSDEERDARIKELVSKADACLIYTGAGMGVDSGLSVFRGKEGLWEKYPDAKKYDLSFQQLANPNNYQKYPEVVMPFYLDRLKSYQLAEPHSGYYELFGFVENLKHKYFAITSNVDGLLEKTGFSSERIYEEHGTIHTWQCSSYRCSHQNKEDGLINIKDFKFKDYKDLTCPKCGELLRPNLCMFYDMDWYSEPSDTQGVKASAYINKLKERSVKNVLILEIGAGTDLRVIRSSAELSAYEFDTQLIRINPTLTVEDETDKDVIFLEKGASDGISHILSLLEKKD